MTQARRPAFVTTGSGPMKASPCHLPRAEFGPGHHDLPLPLYLSRRHRTRRHRTRRHRTRRHRKAKPSMFLCVVTIETRARLL
jgi:hypothetical protein